MRKCCIERRGVGLDLSTCTIGTGQDQDTSDQVGLPRESILGDLPADQTLLFVELAHGVIDPDEIGLDLLDDHRAAVEPPAEDIDGAAFAVDRVGDLDLRIPTATPELEHGCLDERRVARV